MRNSFQINALREDQFCWVTFGLLVLFSLVAYLNTIPGEWVWDDASSVLLHKHVQQPGKFFQLFKEDQHAFGRGEGNFYRPLVSASFMLDYLLSSGPAPGEYDAATGPDVSPVLFHVSNFLFHLLAALLFWRFLRLLNAARFVQLTAPLLFVVHPLHTEAVAYISGRADMMSAIGIFGALGVVAASLRSGNCWTGILLSTICFIGGLLSKESTLIYPVLLAVTLPAMLQSRNEHAQNAPSSLVKSLLPLMVAAGVLTGYIALRATILKFSQQEAADAVPFFERLVETMISLGVYGRLLFIPTGLHMERTLDHLSPIYAVAGVLFFLALLFGGLTAWRFGKRRLAAGCFWFIASWLPISGIFPLNAPMAEHWMYVPMAGFWWALMELMNGISVSRVCFRRAWLSATVMLCLLFTGMTVLRNFDWRDNVTLFRATLKQNPNSARVHYNLAVAYEDFLGNDAGARRHYEYYLELQAKRRAQLPKERAFLLDDEVEAQLALGRVLIRLQEYEEAVYVLAPLVRLGEVDSWKPYASLAAVQAGQALLALGEIVQSHQYFEQAARINPELTGEIERMLSGAPFFKGY